VRETEKEAWAAADNLIKYVDDDTIAAAKPKFHRVFNPKASVGWPELHAGSVEARRRSEHCGGRRPGARRLRHGARGDPDQVRRECASIKRLVGDTFILSGYPHLEESYRVAELLSHNGKFERRWTSKSAMRQSTALRQDSIETSRVLVPTPAS